MFSSFVLLLNPLLVFTAESTVGIYCWLTIIPSTSVDDFLKFSM